MREECLFVLEGHQFLIIDCSFQPSINTTADLQGQIFTDTALYKVRVTLRHSDPGVNGNIERNDENMIGSPH